MKTENEMNNNGQKSPVAGNGTRKPNFRHKNYRYKAQPKKDGQKNSQEGRPAKGNYKPQLRSQGKPALKRPRKNNNGSKLKIIPLGTDRNEYYSFRV